MKLTHITNACCIYDSKGYKILCDPWLSKSCFYGAWEHPHPLQTKPQDVADYDLLYISHLHPDHFDPETLNHFDRKKPVLILDQEPNYLERMLRNLGFSDLVKLKDQEEYQAGPFKITMFKAFCPHPFFESEIGNPIDSSIVVDDGQFKVFNANDNTPDLESVKMLKNKFGMIHVAQLNYNCAGPYPACFQNLDLIEKDKAHAGLVRRNLDHVIELCHALEPKYFMPFAGEYVLAGENSVKNNYLGTTSPHFAAQYVKLHLPHQKTLVFREGDTFDLTEMPKIFWGAVKFAVQYDYASDSLPASAELHSLMHEAGLRLSKKQDQLNCFPDWDVIINEKYPVYLSRSREKTGNVLRATMDPALFFRILTGKAHWNNAEIGCHIEFYRTPNFYNPDVHLLLSYLHA